MFVLLTHCCLAFHVIAGLTRNLLLERPSFDLCDPGDSGIGRAVSIHFAKEGADIAIAYFDEDDDAYKTKALVEQEGRKCVLLKEDISHYDFCKKAVDQTVKV
jgi:hypothetical protein